MRPKLLPLLLVLGSSGAAATPPAAYEQYGNIYYRAANGSVRQLTRDGNCGEPSLSPDQHTVAFIHKDTKPSSEGESGQTSLWIGDGVGGKIRRLLSSRPNDQPERNLTTFGNPVFSLDGGYVYIEADAWATSSAIHQVSLSTGQERFIVGGWLDGVLRNGPYRGYLVVGQHKYRPAPKFGSYNSDVVIRPDSKEILRVPGTEIDDGRDRLSPWLKMKGWRL